uniref:carboxypeptidase-like regulatory domain-containing protein n=1 Tax=Fulvivirga sp. TaxID=1931237 RepID=UPI004049B3DC
MNGNQMKKVLFALTILSFMNLTRTMAQELQQTIRGKVIDQDSKISLPGANVIVIDSDPLLGSSTDINGEFRIGNVPVGRVSLKISYIGYEDRIIPNILVTSGKEVLLDIEVRESLISMDEIVITAGADKSEIANEMALISARGFTVEETKKVCGFI